MIYLVGDVQGCDAALGRLVDAAGLSPSRDRVVLLGDLVNRGPDSAAVLRRVAAWGESAVSLLGNHDLHLLAVAHGVRRRHKGDTFGDVLDGPEAAHWVDWLRRQRLAHTEAGWLCVHAGLLPPWRGADALTLAAEVEAVLQGPACGAFLQRMYGNEPRRWHDGIQGYARLRCIVNALTRLRFCTDEGDMDFATKDSAAAAPAGYRPWFEVPGRAHAGERIAFGHWSTLGLLDTPALLGIDTGCVWGGALTGVRVDGGRREVLQVPCPQARQPGT